MIRLLVIALALLFGSCAAHDEGLGVGEIDIVGLESVEVAGDNLPDQITLRLEVSNDDKRFSIRSARLRVGIGARRSVAFTLAEPVVVRRGESVVELPIRITVAHNSRSVALRNALKQHKLSLIEFDGELKVRRGIASRTMSFSSRELREMLTESVLEKLWSIVDENIKDE
ncbi:MAG: hypothetical protein IKV33_06210 [Alistipes sp.]|nr:hypothetical protein [Alistipes sp.]